MSRARCSICGEELREDKGCTQCERGRFSLTYRIFYRGDISYYKVVEDLYGWNAVCNRCEELLDPATSIRWARHRGLLCHTMQGHTVNIPIPKKF